MVAKLPYNALTISVRLTYDIMYIVLIIHI